MSDGAEVKTSAPFSNPLKFLSLAWGRSLVHKHSMIYGYARVSTDGQDVEAQADVLRAAGAETIVSEIASGARQRPRLKRLIDKLGYGDVLLVTRIDRLARSTLDLHLMLDAVAKRGAGFRSLRDPWADTTSPHGRLILTVLAGLAEYERELIKARTSEGRARAKARGVKQGWSGKLTDFQRQEARARLERGEPPSEVARSYGVSRWTIQRLRSVAG